MPRSLVHLKNTIDTLYALAIMKGGEELPFEVKVQLAEVESLYLMARSLETIAERLRVISTK